MEPQNIKQETVKETNKNTSTLPLESINITKIVKGS